MLLIITEVLKIIRTAFVVVFFFFECQATVGFLLNTITFPLSTSSSSSFQTALCNFHAMAVEEDNCKIALVVEPQISKPDW